MSRMDQPSADDVILDLLVDDVDPTHKNLSMAIAAHPEHREELIAFFAGLAHQAALNDETAPLGVSVEQFANIGLSRVLARRRGGASQAGSDRRSARGKTPAAAPPERLCDLVRASGLSEDQVAERAGLDRILLMKLDRRRIVGRRPAELFQRLADELNIPPAHVIASATGPPLSSSRMNLRKSKRPVQIVTETFKTAILNSTLSDELKNFWLQRLADADEPSA